MRTYIDRLNRENRENQLIRAYENEMPNIEVQYTYENCFYGELILRKEIEDSVVTRVYHLTDYDCDAIKHPVNLDNKSALEFPDSKVKKIYISFMSKIFSDYRDNYLKATNEQAIKYLG